MARGVRQNNSKYWIWVVIVIVVLTGVWFFTRRDTVSNTNQNSNQLSAVNSGNQNQVNGLANTNSSNANTPSNQNSATVALVDYSDTANHFSLSYPSTWNKSTSVTGSGADKISSLTLNDPKHADISVSISVMGDTLEGQVKNSISVSAETTETVNGQAAQRLTGGSAKDGSPVTIMIFKKAGTLYSLRGSGQDYESIVKSFEIK